MASGWTVDVLRKQLGSDTPKREHYDCAIPTFEAAESAVHALLLDDPDVIEVFASAPLTADIVRLVGLKEGEIRKRIDAD